MYGLWVRTLLWLPTVVQRHWWVRFLLSINLVVLGLSLVRSLLCMDAVVLGLWVLSAPSKICKMVLRLISEANWWIELSWRELALWSWEMWGGGDWLWTLRMVMKVWVVLLSASSSPAKANSQVTYLGNVFIFISNWSMTGLHSANLTFKK